MSILQLDFQAGFSDDTAVVRAGGREVANRQGLRTDYSIGRADSVSIELPAGAVELEIQLPRRRLSTRLTVDAAATPHLAVSVVGDRLEHRASETPFDYF